MKQWFKGRAKPAALSAALMAALCLTAPLIAEDIDIYTGVSPNGDLPNVLLVLDNSANWTTSIPAPNCYYRENGVVTTNGPRGTNPGMEQGKKIAIEKCALYNLFDALPVRTDVTNPDADALFNVGLMLLNESPNNGAYPRKAFVPLTTNNKAALKAIVAGLSINADKGSNADFSKALYEAYLYFTGGSPYQGRSGGKFDTAAFSASGRYVSPATASCGRNHIIFIANGSPEAS
jgi:type IV pilus assembly protein PilY1